MSLARRLLIGAGVIFCVSGCASRPINEPIKHVDLTSGYRASIKIPKVPNNDSKTLFLLAFSGGGTRAAALSYGVLEELQRTEVVVDGHQRRLLDEVDLITGVSGGSFTALSYALYGDQLFSEYETRFLKRNVQGALAQRTLNPVQLAQAASAAATGAPSWRRTTTTRSCSRAPPSPIWWTSPRRWRWQPVPTSRPGRASRLPKPTSTCCAPT